MSRSASVHRMRPATLGAAAASYGQFLRHGLVNGILVALLASGTVAAQVITLDTSGKVPVTANGTVDRRYAQIQPTSVPLSKSQLDTRTRLNLVRVLQSEQGFAMRPLPRGHKGITLAANGKLSPANESYLNMVTAEGLCAKPGDRVVITDIKFQGDKIVFLLNGGPDWKHRFLRHISLGADPDMTTPVVRDDPQAPMGARLTLTFSGHVPEMTGAQVKALLAPLISFDVKTPIQAFTDTLPPPLKAAILDHNVLVGMTTDMVLFAKGQPRIKMHEMDGQMPIDIWIYGVPPQTVDFVRINGNRVIRLEVCDVGKPTHVFDKDVVYGMMRTDGTPVLTAQTNVHVVQEGDVHRDPDKQAPAPPPTLRQPGEQGQPDLTNPSGNNRVGVMRPVQMPKEQPQPQLGANPDDQPPASPSAAQQPPTAATPAPAGGAGQPPPMPDASHAN